MRRARPPPPACSGRGMVTPTPRRQPMTPNEHDDLGLSPTPERYPCGREQPCYHAGDPQRAIRLGCASRRTTIVTCLDCEKPRAAHRRVGGGAICETCDRRRGNTIGVCTGCGQRAPLRRERCDRCLLRAAVEELADTGDPSLSCASCARTCSTPGSPTVRASGAAPAYSPPGCNAPTSPARCMSIGLTTSRSDHRCKMSGASPSCVGCSTTTSSACASDSPAACCCSTPSH